MQARLDRLLRWVRAFDGDVEPSRVALLPVAGDASFRRYYRVVRDGEATGRIAVDAPPEQEDSAPFVHVARLLAANGLNVPVVHEADLDQGFMLLSDFGDRLFSDALTDEASAAPLYDLAFDSLLRMQCIPASELVLPQYDEGRLLAEMALFPDWFVEQQLGLALSAGERRLLQETFDLLIENALEQPQVFVHRDYHSRNLMITAAGPPGIIDFQDAVVGPVTYDLVSLLRDCYLRWDDGAVRTWALAYGKLAAKSGLIADYEESTFLRWFDLMGLQRHIKVAGIFSRLNLRDGKPLYLHDIPRVVRYILDVCAGYSELDGFRGYAEELYSNAMAAHREFWDES